MSKTHSFCQSLAEIALCDRLLGLQDLLDDPDILLVIGIEGALVRYLTARKQIYLPCYKWVLEKETTQSNIATNMLISRSPPRLFSSRNFKLEVQNLCCFFIIRIPPYL